MSEHPLQGIMSTAMSNIKEMVDVNTIIGEAITTPDGCTIIPISKVSFGFASGGSDFCTKHSSNDKSERPSLFGGGSGAGISITPIAFLVVGQGNIKLLQISENANTIDKAVSMIPDIIDKISQAFKKNKHYDDEFTDAY